MTKVSGSIKNVFVSQIYSDVPGLGVAGCGHWVVKDHVLENRTRQDYLIIYCTGGSGIYIEGKKEYKIRKGMLFAAFADIVHSYWCDEDGWEIWFVHFGGDMAERLLNWTGLSPFHPVVQIGIKNDLLTTFEQLLTTAIEKKLNYEITSAGFLYQLLLQVKTCIISTQIEKSGLQKAIDSGTDSIDQMAKYAGMSKFHFIREFKKTTGTTPGQYIMRRKITHAKELLLNRQSMVKEVAFKAGFNDADYFSKVFKKYTGYRPDEFRNISD